MNPIQIAADVCHLVAVLSLIFQILKSRSCAGLSAKTQAGYFIVFASRYMDIMHSFYSSIYLFVGKLTFLTTSLVTLLLIYVFRKTYDRKSDSFRFEILVVASLALALFCNYGFTFLEIAWAFSIYLESVVVIPQLVMIRDTGKAESITYLYLIPLGMYRLLYIANWVYRYYASSFYDGISVFGGCLQTLLYFVFFYMYCTRDGFEKLEDLSAQDI